MNKGPEPVGPIGILICQLHHMAATFDIRDMTIRSKATTDFRLLRLPIQGVKMLFQVLKAGLLDEVLTSKQFPKAV